MKAKTGKCTDCSYTGPLISGRCRNHYWAYRKSLKPKQRILRPVKRIKSVSGNQVLMNRLYLRERANFMLKHEVCQCGIPGCTIKSTDIHHKAGRVGKNLYDPENFLAVCRNCHNYIEMNPLWAKETGYSLSRIKKD